MYCVLSPTEVAGEGRGGVGGGGNCEHNNENSSFLKRDNLLNTWGNTSFCRQTLFHEVSYLFELKKKTSAEKLKFSLVI